MFTSSELSDELLNDVPETDDDTVSVDETFVNNALYFQSAFDL